MFKADIINKKFYRGFFGYKRNEVDQFIQEVAEEIGTQAEKNKGLQEKIKTLESALDEYKSRESTLRDALMTTQKMVDDIKSNARKEARLIIDKAQCKAEELLNNSHMHLSQVNEDIAELKRQRTQFQMKLRSLLEAHIKMLEMEETSGEQSTPPEESSGENKIKYFKKA